MTEESGNKDGDIQLTSYDLKRVGGSGEMGASNTATAAGSGVDKGDAATRCHRFLAWDGSLLVLSLLGAVVGFVIGFSLYAGGTSSTALVWIGLPGELYMRMLKAAVLPLIISSIISGTAGLKPKENGRVSGIALGYIISTNILGAIVGALLAVIIKPGSGGGGADLSDTVKVDTGNLQTSDLFADLIRNLVPDNVVSACFQKAQTVYRESASVNSTHYVRHLGTSAGTNILGLVIASAALGMAAAQTGEVARPFLNFFTAAAEVIIKLIHWMIWLTPLGVASLIAKAIGSTQDLVATFKGLGLFVLAEVIGNFLTGFVFIALFYFLFLRKNPFSFLAGASRAVIAGVASASSAVAMPEVLNCVERRHRVDIRVSRFVVPVATAINRDGSAMFMAVTAIYMAQLQGSPGVSDIILITVLSSVGSLAVPGVPSSSIVTILMILDSLDIPPANIGIVIALEWFSDRMRAIPNVYSHVLCTVLTWHFCKGSLGFAEETDDKENTPKEATQTQPSNKTLSSTTVSGGDKTGDNDTDNP